MGVNLFVTLLSLAVTLGEGIVNPPSKIYIIRVCEYVGVRIIVRDTLQLDGN
jgi:hypothetical protein